MKVVFLSNFFNHHQKSFSTAMNDLCDEYVFIATVPMPTERKNLGYNENDIPSYVRFSYLSDDEKCKCQELIDNADVVVSGSAPEHMLLNRIKNNKIIFRYAERPLKNGLEALKYFPRLIKWHKQNPRKKPIYMLCASAYTASDYGKFGLFKNRTYKWGYFPETRIYDIDLLMNGKLSTEILWCGRFLDWKHPDDVIKAVSRLKTDGYKFKLNMIGCGEFENAVAIMIKEYDLSDCVELLGSMSPEKVREYMERSGVYLFTSDKKEGWGAVLNEAMNSGCAVIASHEAGAVPFLVNDRENGLVYESGNVDMLYDKIKYLLDDPTEQKRLGRTAYSTIVKKWNAENAANRVFRSFEEVVRGNKNFDVFEDGPCSKAEIIKENWFARKK